MPATTKGQRLDCYVGAVDRLAGLLRSVPDGATKVPNLSWTVSETAAHMVASARGVTAGLASGRPLWADHTQGAEENQRLLQAVPERDPADLADALVDAASELRKSFESHGDEPVPWLGAIRVPVATIAGVEAADVLVHGWDIANATGRRWRIAPEEVFVAADGALEIVPHFVAPEARGFSGTYGLHLRGGPDYTMVFADGDLRVEGTRPTRADCRISADPEAYLLSAYGRIPPWKVAVTGKMVAYGRRPWLAFKLGTMLRNP